MTPPIQVQLYLADQRGCSQTPHARSFHTFNFDRYFSESREPFHSLTTLNDNLLAAGYCLSRQVDQQTNVVVIPVVGGLEFDGSVGHGFVPTGQAQLFSLSAGMDLTIRNPYETEVIHFIEIWLVNPSSNFVPAHQQLTIDLSNRNILVPLADQAGEAKKEHRQPFTGFLGTYDGRRDGSYQIKPVDGKLQANGIFVFVLQGAVEVQDRLLHTGDGLALTTSDQQAIDFEALSNDAIILLFEVP